MGEGLGLGLGEREWLNVDYTVSNIFTFAYVVDKP